RSRLPADDRARPRAREAARADRPDRAAGLRLHPEPADAGAPRRGEVRQPLAPPRVRRAGVPRAAGAALPLGRAAGALPRPQAAGPRAGDPGRLGSRPRGPAHHQALLRPLHPGDQRARLPAEHAGPRCGPGLLGGVRGVRRGGRGATSWVRMADRPVGDLAIVLHSHMPYVEGFGTYPFGEEWLFDAFARSHLPVLDVAERLTMTVTPVLADQLEAD